MVIVTLIYQDGTRWNVGGFSTIEDANKWISDEKAKLYWIDSTQIEIIDNTPKI